MDEKSYEVVPYSKEWFADKLEEMRVRWFMLDAQQKQAAILIGLSIATAVVDAIKALVIAKLNRSND